MISRRVGVLIGLAPREARRHLHRPLVVPDLGDDVVEGSVGENEHLCLGHFKTSSLFQRWTTTVPAILSCQPCLRLSKAAQMKPMPQQKDEIEYPM